MIASELSISIIIPTLNEEKNIGKLVKFINKHGGEKVKEIIVSDAESTDNTIKEAEEAGAFVIHNLKKSRATQMNAGAFVAQGEIFYFVHADVFPPESFANDILEAVAQGFKMGAYRSRFEEDNSKMKFNAWMTRFKLLYCRGGDQTLFVTRKHFQELNGFDESFVIMEDYDIIQRSWFNNKFKVFDKAAFISTRKYNTNSFLRVNFANFWVFVLYFAGAKPERMAATYKKLLTY
ncbi:MAG: TIGR04283 family arsenosugar biosynthesis glycosyltransferase [Flavobacteriales bacterium]